MSIFFIIVYSLTHSYFLLFSIVMYQMYLFHMIYETHLCLHFSLYASAGPMQGIVIFNNLVLGGVLFGMIGGLVKYVVERSKIAEIRNKTWGR